MAYISQLTLPSGVTYDIKDTEARQLIGSLSSYTDYKGVVDEPLVDGATTNPVLIGGSEVTAVIGNIVTSGQKELIWNGEKWQEFGDLSGLKALAYKDVATGSYTPAGTISDQTFSGGGTFTPAGTVSKPEFTGTAVAFTPKGGVTVGEITPTGSISDQTFTGTAGEIKVAGAFTYDYTPSGTVSAPTVSITSEKNNAVTGVTQEITPGVAADWQAQVSGENLSFTWTKNTPTAVAAPEVATGEFVVGASASATAPTFSGEQKTIAGAVNSEGSFTPAGTVSKGIFSGTAVTPVAEFTGTEGSVVAAGTVTQPTFTGTSGSVSVSGSVTKGVFTGTSEVITVQ